MDRTNNISKENIVDDASVYTNLVAAILKRAKEDYILGKHSERYDVIKFMRSEYYSGITNMRNGTIALRYWEELRRKKLGEGFISCNYDNINDKIFLIEAALEKNERMRRTTLIVVSDTVENALAKAEKHGVINQKQYIYQIDELIGVNENADKMLKNSKDKVIIVKEETM